MLTCNSRINIATVQCLILAQWKNKILYVLNCFKMTIIKTWTFDMSLPKDPGVSTPSVYMGCHFINHPTSVLLKSTCNYCGTAAT